MHTKLWCGNQKTREPSGNLSVYLFYTFIHVLVYGRHDYILNRLILRLFNVENNVCISYPVVNIRMIRWKVFHALKLQ
jgi:hypothetical protein